MSRSTRRRISTGTSASLRLVLLQDRRPERVGDGVVAEAVDVDRVELVRLDAVDLRHRGRERGVVALVFAAAVAGVAIDRALEQLFRQRHQVLAAVDVLLLGEVDPALEQLAAQRVDALALLVHHVVVLEQVLADGEVLRFDLLLRPGDGVGHHLVLDRHAFFHAETLHQAGDAVGAEDAHQIVFEREVEPRRAGIALTAGAAAQLVVDAPRLVPLGGDDVQAAGVDDLVVLAIGLALERVGDALVGLARHAIEVCRGGRSRRTRRRRRTWLPPSAASRRSDRRASAAAP